MGLGTTADSHYVIEYEELKKVCPTAIENIEKESFFQTLGWLGIAVWLSGDRSRGLIKKGFCDVFLEEYEEDSVTIEVAWLQTEAHLKRFEKHIWKLKKDFKEMTGWELGLCAYSRAAGDRNVNPCDKDGCIFVVDGMTQPTPAGEKS